MALENESGEEKTEQPTGRRVGESRSEGMVAKSADLSQVIALIAAYLTLQKVTPSIWNNMILATRGSYSFNTITDPITIQSLRYHFYGLLKLFLPDIFLLMGIAALVGAMTTAIQTNFLWSSKLLRPKFSLLNPLAGIKRIFSKQNLVNLLKSITKLAIIGPVAYFAFFGLVPQFIRLMDFPMAHILQFTSIAIDKIFWRIIYLLLFLAILDYIWQRYTYGRNIKMTKQEVKEERKSLEGDEGTKRRILQAGLQRARNRMMKAVPKADVVVTNPTHIAVALSYKMAKGSAPKVLAKGKGFIAEKIKEIARANNIPVVERKPLARALFAAVEVGKQIPYELYEAVAELLAYVYRIKGKNPLRRNSQQESPNK